ncbi:hypothetical protein NDU88_010726 [Pleurodeles waltl]|uniref:Uncharacterized protein n=1 Tax=Pleurodeles waltl TaxID=8319 RepID=A0AAV7QY60_PLEWA|nr:hypothetical protein NDU88_010726 [Pleurodeles waltl]
MRKPISTSHWLHVVTSKSMLTETKVCTLPRSFPSVKPRSGAGSVLVRWAVLSEDCVPVAFSSSCLLKFQCLVAPQHRVVMSCEEPLVPAEMEPGGKAVGIGGDSEASSTLLDFSDREDGDSGEPQKMSEFIGSRRSKGQQPAYQPCASESELEEARPTSDIPEEQNNQRVNANNWFVFVN